MCMIIKFLQESKYAIKGVLASLGVGLKIYVFDSIHDCDSILQ